MELSSRDFGGRFVKHYRRSCAWLLLLLALLAGCSQRTPYPPDAVVVIQASSGGTLDIPGPLGTASFFFPPGILTADTEVQGAVVDDTLPPPGGDIIQVGPAYFVGPPCLTEGVRIVSGGRVNITLPYTEGAIPAGRAEQDLTILFFDKGSETWSIVPSTVNQASNVVSGSFGTMCIFAVGSTTGAPDSFNIDFNALPTTIVQGDSAELSWEISSLTGRNIETITVLEGRNGDGIVLETFDNIDSDSTLGTLDISPTETTEYTLRVTDGTATQTSRVTVNVLPNIVAEAIGPDVFRFPVPTIAEAATFSFTVSEGTLNYSLRIGAPDNIVVPDEEDRNGTVAPGETKDIAFEVTCREAIDETIDIFSSNFGVVGSFRVICFVPPGTLTITPDFNGAAQPINAMAVVQGNDSDVNQSVNLGTGAVAELELPSGNYTITFPNATDANGTVLAPTSTQQTVFVPPDGVARIAVSYFEQ